MIPCLLLRGTGLVKTIQFRNPSYVGDPRNTVKIFNEKEVDELALLDIAATPEGREPQLALIREIVSEAFMPITYGGGVRTVEQARVVLAVGVEKIVVNTAAIGQPDFIRALAEQFGSQSVIASIDAKKGFWGRYEVWVSGGRTKLRLDPAECAAQAEASGAGEILLTSIDRDGTRSGYDLDLIRAVSAAVQIPVVACGGAGSVEDLALAVKEGGAAAAAAGSLFVHQGKHRAVLISYPTQAELRALFAER